MKEAALFFFFFFFYTTECIFIFLHLLCRVDVHALVELLLEQRHHGVIPWDSVNAGVFQTHLLHEATADLHNHWNELQKETRKRVITENKEKENSFTAFRW